MAEKGEGCQTYKIPEETMKGVLEIGGPQRELQENLVTERAPQTPPIEPIVSNLSCSIPRNIEMAGTPRVSFKISSLSKIQKYDVLEGVFPMNERKRRRVRAGVPEIPELADDSDLQEKVERALAKGREVSDQIEANKRERAAARERVKGKGKPFFVKPDLPNELIVEILSWLPLDCYCRAKILGKYFNFHLSNPSTMKPHSLIMVLPRSKNRLLGVGTTKSTGDLEYLYKFPQPPENVKEVVGVSNGVLCLYVWDPKKPLPDYMIYNPAKRESLILPSNSMELEVTMHGFGYAEGQYKVVVFSESRQSILTFGTNSWRTSKTWKTSTGRKVWDNGPRDGAYLNGCLHWISRNSDTILVFHLHEEYFEEFGIPHNVAVQQDKDNVYPDKVVAVGTLAKSLSVLVKCRFTTEVYTMSLYGVNESWEKKKVIWTDAAQHTRILRYEMYGHAEHLIILHGGRLGIIRDDSTQVSWSEITEPLDKATVTIETAFVIQPTLFSLNQLGILLLEPAFNEAVTLLEADEAVPDETTNGDSGEEDVDIECIDDAPNDYEYLEYIDTEVDDDFYF